MSEKRLPTEPPESHPLPWYADERISEPGEEGWWRVYTGRAVVVAVNSEQPDLADYIVAACNGFPVLLKVVREVLAERPLIHDALTRELQATVKLEAALDKIGGGS